jgi:O-antigen ligase
MARGIESNARVGSHQAVSLSTVGAGMFAVGIALFLVPQTWSSVAGRIVITVSMLLALGMLSVSLSAAERRWLRITALFFVSIVVAAFVVLLTTDLRRDRQDEVLFDLARQAFIFCTSWALLLHLRGEKARKVFGFGMTVVGMVCSGIVLWSYIRYSGLSLVTDFAEYKATAHFNQGVEVNPLSFAGAIAILLGWNWWRSRRSVAAVVIAVTSAEIIVSGSRTTQAAFVGAAVVAMFMALWTASRSMIRIAARIAVAAILVFVTVVALTGDSRLTAADVSSATTGRLDVWVAAITQFTEKPLAGWGAKSYLDVVAYMPDYYRWGATTLTEAAEAGGFHQAYLGLMAQRGLIGSIPGILVLWTLSAEVFRRQRAMSSQIDRRSATVAVLFVLSVLLRGLAEQPGFFGAADGLLDFLVFAGASYVVTAGVHFDGTGQDHAGSRRVLACG